MRQERIYGNMAESELLCVRVASLLRNKYASLSDVTGKTYHNCHDFYFTVLDIVLALSTV